MSRTLGDCRDDLRARLDEVSARFWTDKELNRWLNEGALDVARRGECLADSTTATIMGSSGTAVPLPIDGFRLHRAEYTNDNGVTVYPLEFRDPNEMDEFWTNRTQQQYRPSFLVPSGYPPNWTAGLYPIPASSGTLTTYYYRTPAQALADTDQLDLPSGWEDLSITYAAYCALRKDGNPIYREIKEEYTEKLTSMIDTTRRFHDQAGYVVAGPSIQPGWLIFGDGGGY